MREAAAQAIEEIEHRREGVGVGNPTNDPSGKASTRASLLPPVGNAQDHDDRCQAKDTAAPRLAALVWTRGETTAEPGGGIARFLRASTKGKTGKPPLDAIRHTS